VGTVDLEAITSVWWRRPSATQLRNVYTGVSRSFVQAEFDHFIEGTVWSTHALWVNDPVLGRRAARKVVQLRKARESGLVLPPTLMSNNADDVRAFAQDIGGPLVVKRVGTGPGPASKTMLFESESIGSIVEELLPTPAIFQKYVVPGVDLRTIWIDGQHWTVRIDSAVGSTPEDCRYDHLVPYAPAELPMETQLSLRRLMSTLGPAYGAIDFRVDPGGQIYFLEVNPAGQFLYLQARVDIPIVEALAALLARAASS
jgi:glutathione synthase/RimK-type ligase-like ATP-grasp enzyme